MRTAPLAALLLATTLSGLPALAQERPAGLTGSGVAPSTRENSPERPIRFAQTLPSGASLIIPVAAPLDVAKAAPGLPAETAAAPPGSRAASRRPIRP